MKHFYENNKKIERNNIKENIFNIKFLNLIFKTEIYN